MLFAFAAEKRQFILLALNCHVAINEELLWNCQYEFGYFVK
jgi:hypothetical protein